MNHRPTPMNVEYLKSRGTCCQSECLHCPYGFTIKRAGLQFKKATDDDYECLEEIDYQGRDNLEDLYFITLKDCVCGVVRAGKLIFSDFYLREGFRDQGISKELAESYFYS